MLLFSLKTKVNLQIHIRRGYDIKPGGGGAGCGVTSRAVKCKKEKVK